MAERGLLYALSLCLALLAGAAAAAGWNQYGNGRYGYALDIPPGFGAVSEADNGDGGTARAGDGAELAVWGAYLLDTPFGDEVAGRIAGDEAAGWRIAYRRETATFASWSGAKGGRIFYARAIPLCDGAAGFFRLDYADADRQAYDGVVKRLVASFVSAGCP